MEQTAIKPVFDELCTVGQQAGKGIQLWGTGHQRTTRPGRTRRHHRTPPGYELILLLHLRRLILHATEYKDLEARVDALRLAHISLLK